MTKKFHKSAFLKSSKYKSNQDLLKALLEDKKYTEAEVESILKKHKSSFKSVETKKLKDGVK